MREQRSGQVTAGAMAIGLVLRVVWVVRAADHPPKGLFDPRHYLEYAKLIAEGRGYVEPLTEEPTAYFPPGYPWFLGIIEWVLVHTPLPDDLPLFGGLAQAVLGAISIGFVALLARRLHSPWAGAVAACVMALYPNVVLHTGAILSETLAVAIILAFLIALVPARREAGWPAGLTTPRVVTAGFVFGALLLTRPQSAAIVIAPAFALMVARAGWRRTVSVVGALVGIGALCLAPWTIRNVIRMDSPVVLSTNTGDNLCIGHGPRATGAFRVAPDCMIDSSPGCVEGWDLQDADEDRDNDDADDCFGIQFGTKAELRSNDVKTERSLRAWREGWRDEPRLTWKRFVATIERDDDAVRAVQSYDVVPWIRDGHARLLTRISNAAWVVVGVFGLVGMVRMLWRHRPDQLLVPVAALALLAAPLLTFGDARFKLPIVPLLIVAASTLLPRRSARLPSD